MAKETKTVVIKIPLGRNDIKKDLRKADFDLVYSRLEWPIQFGFVFFLLSSFLLLFVREEYRVLETVIGIIFALSSATVVYIALCFLRLAARLSAINAGKFKIEILPLDHIDQRIIFEPSGRLKRGRLYKSVWYFYFPSRRWRVTNLGLHYSWSHIGMDTKTLVDGASAGELYYVATLNCDEKRGKIGYVYSTNIFEYDEKI